MSYQLNRFIGNVDELLICVICHGVLQNPMQCTICEHPFCQSCINSWISNSSRCPANHHHMLLGDVVSVPRVLRNLLGRLKIKCAFAENGCQAQLPLENLQAHEASCEKNPNTMVTCNEGCGLLLPRGELEQHSCLSKLRALMEQQRDQIQQLQLQLAAKDKIIGIHNNELENLHHFIHCLRRTFPAIGNIGKNWDRFSLTEWGVAFPLAIVRNWGNMVSRPNCAMMSDLKDSLRKQGCPMQVIDKMVYRSREVNAFEFLHGYRLRLLQPLSSGEQCVLILGDENNHMPINLMRLGLIMVFEDGVERAVDNATTNETNDDSDSIDTESVDNDGDDDGTWGPARPQMMSLPVDAHRERDHWVSDPQVANNGVGALQDSIFNAGFVTIPQVGSNGNTALTATTPINDLVTNNDRACGPQISASRVVNNDGVDEWPPVGATNNNYGAPVSGLRSWSNFVRAGRAARLALGFQALDAPWQTPSSVLPIVTYYVPPPTSTTAAVNVGNAEEQGDDSGNNGSVDDVV